MLLLQDLMVMVMHQAVGLCDKTIVLLVGEVVLVMAGVSGVVSVVCTVICH